MVLAMSFWNSAQLRNYQKYQLRNCADLGCAIEHLP